MNTAILLGRDGAEIGRYHKVNLPLAEQNRKRGDSFPVFETPELGGIGMCICYDMVFPETSRALALGGADVVFHLTMGGASAAGLGDEAFMTRAADSEVYLIVSWRGNSKRSWRSRSTSRSRSRPGNCRSSARSKRGWTPA